MALEYLTWWLSPGVACFLLLNVLVAAIAVTSRSRTTQQGSGAAATTTRRLCRSTSSMVLDRLRSFSFSAMLSTHHSVELCYYYYDVSPEAEELKQVSGAAPDREFAVPELAAMSAAISMMSENAEDETAAGVVKSTSSDGDGTQQESMPSSPPPAAAPAHVVAVVTAETTASRVALVRGPPKDEPATTVPEFVKRRHRAHVHALEGKAELNARAEQFIRQFRQELQLQRLDSMLSRHAHGHTLSSQHRIGRANKQIAFS